MIRPRVAARTAPGMRKRSENGMEWSSAALLPLQMELQPSALASTVSHQRAGSLRRPERNGAGKRSNWAACAGAYSGQIFLA